MPSLFILLRLFSWSRLYAFQFITGAVYVACWMSTIFYATFHYSNWTFVVFILGLMLFVLLLRQYTRMEQTTIAPEDLELLPQRYMQVVRESMLDEFCETPLRWRDIFRVHTIQEADRAKALKAEKDRIARERQVTAYRSRQ